MKPVYRHLGRIPQHFHQYIPTQNSSTFDWQVVQKSPFSTTCQYIFIHCRQLLRRILYKAVYWLFEICQLCKGELVIFSLSTKPILAPLLEASYSWVTGFESAWRRSSCFYATSNRISCYCLLRCYAANNILIISVVCRWVQIVQIFLSMIQI